VYIYLFIFLFNSTAIANLIRPEDGQELTYIHMLFEWEQEPNAISYNLQVSNQQSFINVILNIEETSTVYIDLENIGWGNTYYWKVRPIYMNGEFGHWSEISSFSIGNKQFPEKEAEIFNEDFIQEGLVAFGGFLPELSSAIIDKYGNEIWNTGEVGNFDFIINHINKFGNIYGLSSYNYPYNTGTKINYDLDFVWSAPATNQIAIDIHEFKQIPNGNYMAFVPDSKLGPIPQGDWTFIYQTFGYIADGITNEYPWVGMRIVEWDKDGNEVWNWDPFEHFTMDDYDAYGGIWWDFQAGSHDWMHSNAFHFDEEENVIYVSHRHLSRISKIAYPSGNVIWNIGMPEQYNTGSENICTDLGNSFQHNIQLLDDGSLLFFDNGNLSEMLMGDSNPTSRLRRIRVFDNSYCETEWEYTLPPNLFGVGMGSVQLLENGNYLLYTFGNGMNQSQPTLREITSENEVVWNYQGAANAAWYRTYKIPSLHPDAFSVIAQGYIENDDGIFVAVTDAVLKFIIYNKSGYSLTYNYILSDLMDGGTQLFIYEEGSIEIEPYGNLELTFPINSLADINETQVMLSVWPNHHEYAQKELVLPIHLVNSSPNGDVNIDEVVNILDVVLMINFALNNEYNFYGDLNLDGVINILDIVELVNIILEN
tara:strand:- start:243 stop:2195 length:1953 start_codon:yes stop_codon:yes gene_type:complete